MKIQDLCHRPVVTVESDAPLQRAAALMAGQHVGALAVVEGDGEMELVGVITDRDLALHGLGRPGDPRELRVGQLARAPAVVVRPRASLREAAETMRREGVRRLVIVDEESVVQGLVSFDDIAGELAADLSELVGALEAGAHREASLQHPVEKAKAPRVLFPSFGTLGMQ